MLIKIRIVQKSKIEIPLINVKPKTVNIKHLIVANKK